MICEICKKKSATIHIQEIINGQKKTLHICPDCAADKTSEESALHGINIAEMLYNLSEQISSPTLTPQEDEADGVDSSITVTCPDCGWDTSKFKKTGRLGCPHCYQTFNELLKTALKNMHRGTLHVGKQLRGEERDESGKLMIEIMNLQKRLEEFVQREEYEKAALVRDKISQLKKKRDEVGPSLPSES